MPIRKEYRRYYKGPAWEATRVPIRDRSGDCCEECGAINGRTIWVYRTAEGLAFWAYRKSDGLWKVYGRASGFFTLMLTQPMRVLARQEGRLKRVTVQCGRAHINHDPSNHDLDNLRYLCRACHLIFDQQHHKETRCIRKDAERPLLNV